MSPSSRATVTSLTPQAAGLSGSPPRYARTGGSGHSGQPFCLSKALPSAVKTSGVFPSEQETPPRPHVLRLMNRAALTLCPAPAQLLASAAGALHPAPHALAVPGGHHHCLWPQGCCGSALTCWSLGMSPLAPCSPLAASARESHTPRVPFTAPVSFSPGNPRRLLCLSLSRTCSHSLSRMEPPLCLFLPLEQLGFFSHQISVPLLGKRVSWVTFLCYDLFRCQPQCAVSELSDGTHFLS